MYRQVTLVQMLPCECRCQFLLHVTSMSFEIQCERRHSYLAFEHQVLARDVMYSIALQQRTDVGANQQVTSQHW